MDKKKKKKGRRRKEKKEKERKKKIRIERKIRSTIARSHDIRKSRRRTASPEERDEIVSNTPQCFS